MRGLDRAGPCLRAKARRAAGVSLAELLVKLGAMEEERARVAE